MVDLVLRRVDERTYRAASARGAVTFRHDPDGTVVIETSGSDPLADTDPNRFLGPSAELAGEIPEPADEARPHAHDEIAQFFDSPHAPDLAIVHTAAHRYHGNAGEHGSLGTVQRRAPFIAAGAGVPARGWVPGHARTVDVAPTVAALAGVTPRRGVDRWGEPHDDLLLARQDGSAIDKVVQGTARSVVVVLWDGCNANDLRAAVDAGDAPNVAGLIARGTALDGGLLASFPSATLANHMTIGTGAFPGHSGIQHNEWRCAHTGEHRNLLDLTQMFHASTHLGTDVETVHEAIHRTRPGAWTGATFEYSDRGADDATFHALAAGRSLPYARRDDDFPRDGHWWEASAQYQFMSRIDETSLRCALAMWTDDHPVPDHAFCNFSLTDEAGHEGGPHSDITRAAIRDSDERLGRLLAAIDGRGVLDDIAVLLIADHGMQRTDENRIDDLADALAGIDHLLVDGSFLYLGEPTGGYSTKPS